MFSEISEMMTQSLIDNKKIQSDNRELYRYGIQQGLTMIMNLATTLLIGLLCGMLWQSIVFYMAYIPLRSYAGGYHAKTPIRCYLFSIAMMFACFHLYVYFCLHQWLTTISRWMLQSRMCTVIVQE